MRIVWNLLGQNTFHKNISYLPFYQIFRLPAILMALFKVIIWQRRYNRHQRRIQASALYCFPVQPFICFTFYASHLCAFSTLLWLVSAPQHSMFLCLQYWSPVPHSCSPSGMSLSHSPIPNHHKQCVYNCF